MWVDNMPNGEYERFLFPSTGKAFLNDLDTITIHIRSRRVSIPFKREGVSEPPLAKYNPREFDEFLFPSTGKAFLNYGEDVALWIS